MTQLTEAQRQRAQMFSNPPTDLAGSVVAHIEWCVRNFQSSAILIQVAEQNTHVVRGKIVEYVAKVEEWSHVDPSSYSSFEVATQTLYLKYNIFIREQQKQMSSPDYNFFDADVSGFNKMFYDLELNATDPYFDVIKRDYYNDVSS